MISGPIQRDEMARMVDAHRYPLHSNQYTARFCGHTERELT